MPSSRPHIRPTYESSHLSGGIGDLAHRSRRRVLEGLALFAAVDVGQESAFSHQDENRLHHRPYFLVWLLTVYIATVVFNKSEYGHGLSVTDDGKFSTVISPRKRSV